MRALTSRFRSFPVGITISFVFPGADWSPPRTPSRRDEVQSLSASRFSFRIREYAPLCLYVSLAWGKAFEVGRGSTPRRRLRPMKNNFKIWCLGILVMSAAASLAAQTTEELNTDGKNPNNVVTQSMGPDRKSYSPLKQINKSTVKKLVPVWNIA